MEIDVANLFDKACLGNRSLRHVFPLRSSFIAQLCFDLFFTVLMKLNECIFSLVSLYVIMFAEWDDKEEGKESLQQWEDDWDDDDVNDDFSLQLRKELEGNGKP